MAGGGIPLYSVAELVKSALEIPGDFEIPKIPENLLLPLSRRILPHPSTDLPVKNEDEGEDEAEDLFESIEQVTRNAGMEETKEAEGVLETGGVREADREKEKEKEKFYIDETNMIERRFLPQDTRTFESVRTVDLFASSCLCETAVDCLRNVAGVDALISAPMRQQFLRGGLDDMETRWFSLLWEHHIPPSRRREYTMAEWGITEDIVKRNIRGGDMALLSLSIALGKAVVLEKLDHSVKTFGACPVGFDEEIYWIKQAPDGYLGVKMTVSDAEKRFKETPDLVISTSVPERKDLGYFTMSSMKVPDLKDHLKRLGGTPGKLKKMELVQAILTKSLWGMIVE